MSEIASYAITIRWKIYVLNGSSATYFAVWDTGLTKYNSSFNASVGPTALCSSSSNYIGLASTNSTDVQLSNIFSLSSSGSLTGVSEVLLLQSKCTSASCRRCSTAENCTLCYNASLFKQLGACVPSCGSQYYSFPEQMQCYSRCPAGTFANEDDVICVRCPPECQQCTSLASCQACSAGYLLYNSTCISACPDKYYPYTQSRRCESCIYPCLTCSNASVCLSCIASFLSNGSCLTVCPKGFYADLIQMKCLSCQASGFNCLECLSKTKCVSCVVGFSLLASSCVAACPDGYFSNGTVCSKCYYRCRTCSLTVDNCTSCAIGFLTNGTCLNTCPFGTYAELSSMSCQSCTAPCSSCANSSAACTSCISGSLIYSGQCLQTCPNGSYASISSCLPCNYPCLSCTSANACSSCL